MKKINLFSIFSLILLIVNVLSCSRESVTNDTGKGGSMARFTISGNYLYTVDNQTLRVFDIGDRATAEQPVYLASRDQTVGFDIETISSNDSTLFIGSQDGMYLYEIENNGFPRKVAQVAHRRSCDPVVSQGNYAYVTLNSASVRCGGAINALQIYDIHNQTNPVLMLELPMTAPKGLAIDGNRLFVCSRGIRMFDISDPINPRDIDDLSYVREANNVEMYDVISNNGILLAVSDKALFQFDYATDTLKFVSQITVKK